MLLLKTTFTFRHEDGGQVIATIQSQPEEETAGWSPSWIVRYYDFAKSQSCISTVREDRTRQYINQARAREIVQRVFKKNLLAILALALVLVSCLAEDPKPKEVEHTFFVYALDQKEFTARIDWGVNGLQEHERVTSWGFASSVELSNGDDLVLQVNAPGLAARVSNNESGAATLYILAPGEFTIIKPL